MIDLHTHTLLSDGELIPTELVRRFEVLGYRAIALTDHVDTGLVETIVPVLVRVAADLADEMEMRVLPGAEVTHCRPGHIARVVRRARQLGARVVVVHGQSPVEPVIEGTNRAAIEAGCDILAHPGLLAEADAHLAAERGVLLEISGRAGHSLTNGHVARLARAVGAQVIYGSDSHDAADLMPPANVERVLAGAGLSADEVQAALAAAQDLVARVLEGEG
ncbi:MAG: histidinol phosphate phosphatase domain-containing protein [Phycisphaerae bacterium]|nr:histidinol phosphate phosphatase domain-containing protein [Phycisphaerae bacterium]